MLNQCLIKKEHWIYMSCYNYGDRLIYRLSVITIKFESVQ